jgi:patatin-like phospholipase
MPLTGSSCAGTIPRLVLTFTAGWALSTGVCGCGGETRPKVSQEKLLETRRQSDEKRLQEIGTAPDRIIHRAKDQYDQYKAGKRAAPPVIDILVISGGGDWGAFGAGFLKGWGRVPQSNPLARPEFAAVTGVSTGALIAPFAFLGDEASLDKIENLYRNPRPDWVKRRGPLYFLPSNVSLAEIPGLERELKDAMSPNMVKRIEDAGADGRLLAVSATNIDDGSPRGFDLVTEARRARESGSYDRIRNIVLASAGIPGVFPYRIIENQMYVDGGVTGNIIYGGRITEEDTLAPTWKQLYPDIPIPKTRFWVLFNNQFRPPPKIVEPNWLSVIQRSMETSTRAATTTSIRHLIAMSQIAELKYNADVEVRVASIPGDWLPPKPKAFDKETMNALVDMGETMGADPKSWANVLP